MKLRNNCQKTNFFFFTPRGEIAAHEFLSSFSLFLSLSKSEMGFSLADDRKERFIEVFRSPGRGGIRALSGHFSWA